eukprot:GFUD01050853.1.p1 GENE.GFUD01050853.1~~GFUD01050853.1.p1  ORF type:complete len:133 (+),score=24.77 GFUD01050853.1:2-400(+)
MSQLEKLENVRNKHEAPICEALGKDLRKSKMGKVEIGGQTDSNDLHNFPAVITRVGFDEPLLLDDIFGPTTQGQESVVPIHPIASVNSVRGAVDFIHKQKKPLTSDKAAQNVFKTSTVLVPLWSMMQLYTSL